MVLLLKRNAPKVGVSMENLERSGLGVNGQKRTNIRPAARTDNAESG
jgi:hypothetical protein